MINRAHKLVLAILALLTLAGQHAAEAQDAPAGMERGRQIAEELCARCHAIGQEGDSPHVEAPPFRTFHQKWPVEQLEEALAEGIVVGHPDMPEFTLEPGDISSLIAYLQTLR
jgi:mono/diheme cytochrome c family protein